MRLASAAVLVPAILLAPVTSILPPAVLLKSLMVPPLMVVPDSVNVLPSSTCSIAPLLLRMSLFSALEPIISIVPALLILVLMPPTKPLAVVLFSVSLLPLSTCNRPPLPMFRVAPMLPPIPLPPVISIVPLSLIVPLKMLVRLRFRCWLASTVTTAPLLNSVSLLSVAVPVMSIRPAFLIAPLASLVRMVGDTFWAVVMLNVLNAVSPRTSVTLKVT